MKVFAVCSTTHNALHHAPTSLPREEPDRLEVVTRNSLPQPQGAVYTPAHCHPCGFSREREKTTLRMLLKEREIYKKERSTRKKEEESVSERKGEGLRYTWREAGR